jgi:hypothetical protein
MAGRSQYGGLEVSEAQRLRQKEDESRRLKRLVADLIFHGRMALPAGISDWSLTSLQQRLVKTGGRLVKHARYYWLLLAEGLLTRVRFAGMLRRIALLPLPAN